MTKINDKEIPENWVSDVFSTDNGVSMENAKSTADLIDYFTRITTLLMLKIWKWFEFEKLAI